MKNVAPAMVAIGMCACVLAACSGGKGKAGGSAPSASPSTAAAAGVSAAASASAVAGKTLFEANCAGCHGANGKGMAGAFPPLAGNALVTGDPDKVIHIVEHGLTGKVVVNGGTYNGEMPSWKATLSSADIANVITYVRSAWGNHASAVTEKQVAATK